MSRAFPIPDSIKTQFSDFEKNINGESKSPLHKKRIEAFDKAIELGLPSTKDEEYKYTNLKALSEIAFIQGSIESISKEDLETIKLDDNHLSIFMVNGYVPDELPKVEGLSITADNELGTPSASTGDFFKSLNDSFFQQALKFKSETGFQQAQPIIIYIVQTGNAPNIIHPRIRVEAASNSNIDLLIKYVVIGEQSSFNNTVVEVSVADGAQCKVSSIQADLKDTSLIQTTNVSQKGNSNFTSATYSFDGKLVRNNLNIDAEGSGSETYMNGLYLIGGDSHVDNHTVVDHQQPHSYSDELYKGIIKDKATAVFNGKIFVRKEAQKTNAFQSNRNILLSDDATINTKPQLEIWADDVRCTHGATTGQLDEEALFYLMARGLDKTKAKSILLGAFVGEVLDREKSDIIKTFVEGKIVANLND